MRYELPVGQRWSTFVQNQAQAIVASDFFTSVTAAFQVLCVFVIIEIGPRRILHCNVTDHPTAEWTLQRFREFVDGQTGHCYVIHDRGTTFSAEVDEALNGFDLEILQTPRSELGSECVLQVGHRTIPRECLHPLSPTNDRHPDAFFVSSQGTTIAEGRTAR
jgi:putative transposase